MKRSSLPQRQTGIRRAVPLKPRSLRAVNWFPVVVNGGLATPGPRPRPKDTGFSRSVKLQCRTRAGNGDPDNAACEACAIWLGRHQGEVQHRDARGMGGTSLEVTDSIVNAVLLCGSAALGTGCHGLAESRDADMNGRGFWLRNGEYPAETPIMLASPGEPGITVWLTPSGGYSEFSPRGGAA